MFGKPEIRASAILAAEDVADTPWWLGEVMTVMSRRFALAPGRGIHSRSFPALTRCWLIFNHCLCALFGALFLLETFFGPGTCLIRSAGQLIRGLGRAFSAKASCLRRASAAASPNSTFDIRLTG